MRETRNQATRFSLRRRAAKALILSTLVAAPLIVYAAGISLSSVSDINTKILCPIGDWMFTILITLSVIMVLVAAYMYLTAGGDAEKVSTATRTLTYVAVAVLVALVAKGFPLVIGSIFGAKVGACGASSSSSYRGHLPLIARVNPQPAAFVPGLE